MQSGFQRPYDKCGMAVMWHGDQHCVNTARLYQLFARRKCARLGFVAARIAVSLPQSAYCRQLFGYQVGNCRQLYFGALALVYVFGVSHAYISATDNAKSDFFHIPPPFSSVPVSADSRS